MLQQFSWTIFLVFFAVLSALWYLALALTIYRKEVFGLFSQARVSQPTSPAAGLQAEQQGSIPISDQVMGESKMPEGLEVVSMGELNFSVPFAHSQTEEKADQVGLVPDVLQELKEIFRILAKEDGTKQDFFSLAAMISEKYGRIGSNPNIGQINIFIRDHAPFAVTLEELEHLWD